MQAEDGDRIVSSDSEELILVDSNDRETGTLNKALCHDGDGTLHRAFSVFLFDDDGRLLLQQRASGKRLWPLYWSNSCCSHPRQGEDMPLATQRRLQQELNVSARLEFVYKFEYQASFGELGAEHELCWVYVGRSDGPVRPNRTEIASVRWVDPAGLGAELDANPDSYTPWFRMEWHRLCDEYRDALERYTRL